MKDYGLFRSKSGKEFWLEITKTKADDGVQWCRTSNGGLIPTVGLEFVELRASDTWPLTDAEQVEHLRQKQEYEKQQARRAEQVRIKAERDSQEVQNITLTVGEIEAIIGKLTAYNCEYDEGPDDAESSIANKLKLLVP